MPGFELWLRFHSYLLLQSLSLSLADDINADRLKTGDLVLFNRDPTLYYLPGAAVVWLRKQLAGTGFDQAGLIVLHKGVPHVLEHTFSGPKLRRYDHRIKCARSKEVIVRPLGLQLKPDQQSASKSFVAGVVESDFTGPAGSSAASSSASALDPLKELFAMAIDPEHNASVDLVASYYRAIGVLPSSPSAGTSPTIRPDQLTMLRLVPPSQPLNDHNLRFGSTIWVRDLR